MEIGARSPAPVAGSLSGGRIIDSPILLLVFFHKALRSELADLHRLTVSLSSSDLCPRRDSIIDLCRRFRFLCSAYKYHCAAEDEVIFRALDVRIKNIACTYCLEHSTINDLFDSVFCWLDALLEDDGNSSKPVQELAFCTGTIETSICQHMLKEEEQVFPLLMRHFSLKEQASLVWEFMCSVPVILLEDFLPWMVSYLSVDEREDVMHSFKEVLPIEKLLQEVVISWLDKKSLLSSYGAYAVGKNEKITSRSVELLKLKEFPQIFSSRKNLTGEKCCVIESDPLQNIASNHPIDGLFHWHGAIRKELKDILEELHQMKGSEIFSTLSSLSGRIMFIADVLIFYSDALEKVILPVLNELGDSSICFSHQLFPEESQIEGLLHVLQTFNAQSEKSLLRLVEELYQKLESFMMGISQHFTFQESEVFPLIHKNCNREMQWSLLYTSLHMMPLGLLKCALIWLPGQLSEDESKTTLCIVKLAGPLLDMPFASLLHEWLCIGYSCKTSLIRKELQEMFKNRSSFIPEQSEEGSGFYSLDLDDTLCKRYHLGQGKANSADKAKDIETLADKSFRSWLSASESPCFNSLNIGKCSTSYSSGINFQIFFSGALKKFSSSKYVANKADASSSFSQEPKPIDHIFHFHKVLENDLEYLVLESATMVEKFEVFVEFQQHFHLVQILYEAHSDAEDEILFPALEAKGMLENISESYSIDHKLEARHFKNMSCLLDEISELWVSLSGLSSTVDVATLDERIFKYRELCVKLHGMCKSMQSTLGQHMQREEIHLWPLFLENFSVEEQEKIVGCIMGRTTAEILQTMIPWFMTSLTPEQQHTMMSSWHKATKNTMFVEWLREWWEGMKGNATTTVIEDETISLSVTKDPLAVVATYLSKEDFSDPTRENCHDEGPRYVEGGFVSDTIKASEKDNGDDQAKILSGNEDKFRISEGRKFCDEGNKQRFPGIVDVTDRAENPGKLSPLTRKFTRQQEHFLTMSQEDLEAAVRKVSRDAALDPKEKSHLIQKLLMSRWIVTKQNLSHSEVTFSSNDGELPGHCASYRDSLKLTFGCSHYKRNCKLLAGCCNQLFTCRYCHDNSSDHSMDMKSTTKMMCMKCLIIQHIGPRCSNISCEGFSMARYFCSFCKLFDDAREIYHCPFCNLCRVGKGLGIDYFHCMNCNACMSRSLAVHICREKCFESNCPICHEDIFTSTSPVKALPCGHLMHSTCFQDYTCTHYTCPICSKSLGDMQVYFGMLDALLAEEKVPEEYCGRTQGILCNDCEKRGSAPFHWLYHKCAHCGSYNTRLL
ncbi:zinc finger protein BRUTUS-like At1g18910 [Tasmannia lanceolata]|uniref:zinc finger protein BRUTUS-like At1g18910 n=1 Tax=Tasmannia lanceolata TaxID=3420 RepID=UPI0040639386